MSYCLTRLYTQSLALEKTDLLSLLTQFSGNLLVRLEYMVSVYLCPRHDMVDSTDEE